MIQNSQIIQSQSIGQAIQDFSMRHFGAFYPLHLNSIHLHHNSTVSKEESTPFDYSKDSFHLLSSHQEAIASTKCERYLQLDNETFFLEEKAFRDHLLLKKRLVLFEKCLFPPLRPFVLQNLNRMIVNLVIQKSIIILGIDFRRRA